MESGVNTRVCYMEECIFDSINGNTDISLVDYILFIQADVDLKPSPNEVRDTTYVSADELKAMFKQPDLKFTPWLVEPPWYTGPGKVQERAGDSSNVKGPIHSLSHISVPLRPFCHLCIPRAKPASFTRLMEIYLCTRDDSHDITSF